MCSRYPPRPVPHHACLHAITGSPENYIDRREVDARRQGAIARRRLRQAVGGRQNSRRCDALDKSIPPVMNADTHKHPLLHVALIRGHHRHHASRASRTTHHTSRITHQRITHHASRSTQHAARITRHASCTHHASQRITTHRNASQRITTHHASRVRHQASRITHRDTRKMQNAKCNTRTLTLKV